MDTVQLAKVSKLLLALEKGKLQDHHGKSLDDIEEDFETASFNNGSGKTVIAHVMFIVDCIGQNFVFGSHM